MPPLFGLLAILSAFITAVFLTPQPLLLELPQNSSRVLSASKWTIRDVVFGVSLPELQTGGKHTQALAAIREVGRETAQEISRVAGSAIDALHKAQAGFEERRNHAYEKIVHGTQRTTSAVSHGMHRAAESGAGAGEFVKTAATGAVHGLTTRAGQAVRASEDAVVDAAKSVGGTIHQGYDFAKETGGDIVDGVGWGVGKVEKGLRDTGRAIGSKFHEATEGVHHKINDVWEFEEATRHSMAAAEHRAWDLVFQTEEARLDKVRQTEEAVVGTGKYVYARGAAVGKCIRQEVFRSPGKSQATTSHRVYDDVTGSFQDCSDGVCSVSPDDAYQGLENAASRASLTAQRKTGEVGEAGASAGDWIIEGAESLGRGLKGRGADIASSLGMTGGNGESSSAESAYQATKAKAEDLLSWAKHSLGDDDESGSNNDDDSGSGSGYGSVDEYGHTSGSPSLYESQQSGQSGQGWSSFEEAGRTMRSISWQFIWAPLRLALLRSLNLALFSTAWGALVFSRVALRPTLGSVLPEPYLTNVQRRVVEKALTVATMWAAVGLGTELMSIRNGKRLDYWHLAELVVVLLVGGLDWLGGTPLRRKLAAQKASEADLACTNLIPSDSEVQDAIAEVTVENVSVGTDKDIPTKVTTSRKSKRALLTKFPLPKDGRVVKTGSKWVQADNAELDEEIWQFNSGADVFSWIVTTALTMQLWRLSCRLVV